jgi:hypothetical protein
VVAACLFGQACDRAISTVADQSVDLSSDWVSITPKERLVVREPVGRRLEIVLPPGVDVHMAKDGKGRVSLPDGKAASVEAQLIDRNGETWHFDWAGWAGNSREDTRLIIPIEGLPDGDVITTVKLRSSNPFRCVKVEWAAYPWISL